MPAIIAQPLGARHQNTQTDERSALVRLRVFLGLSDQAFTVDASSGLLVGPALPPAGSSVTAITSPAAGSPSATFAWP